MDIFGSALLDQFNNDAAEILWLHNTYAEPEEMPVDVFFRDETDMPDLELKAMEVCRGKTLDVGAGAGSHSLVLQHRGFDITALEISTLACSVIEKRGVEKVVNQNFFSYQNEKFDTLLMMMNGIGIAGSLPKLPDLLSHCKTLLKENGQIIFDSSDISYLYTNTIPFPTDRYYGEISYRYRYKNITGRWFDWLYVDRKTLTKYVTEQGFKMEILDEDDQDQYLARLTR